MRVDAQLKGRLDVVERDAVAAERDGYAGLWSAETTHDPFVVSALAAARTDRIEVGTAIAVAFARTPMTTAYAAHDLQVLSGGRFVLGLGSQVRAHVERRFSMPWSHPAERMREYVVALRAIWADWNDEVALEHEGRFYRHTLMTPLFRPERSQWGPPPVLLAAVGERMVGVAGEVADGLVVHSFSSVRSLRERTLPAYAAGLRASGRDRAEVQVSLPLLVATGVNEEARASALSAVRSQLAFYASTPAYRWVLELHDLGDLGDRLTALSRTDDLGRWDAMAALLDDDVVAQFAVCAEPSEVGPQICRRYSDLVERISLYAPYRVEPGVLREIAQDVAGRAVEPSGEAGTDPPQPFPEGQM